VNVRVKFDRRAGVNQIIKTSQLTEMSQVMLSSVNRRAIQVF